MIKIKYIGRMGNNIFQYVFARIIHEETGLAMGIEHTGWPFENQEYFPNAIYKDGNVINNLTYMEDLTNSDDFLNKVITQCRDTGVILSGFYQNYKYYLSYRDKIKEWLYTPINPKFIPEDNDWIMHIRREDYLEGDNAISLNYYKKIIDDNKNDINRLYIVGKDLEPEIVNYFYDNYSAIHHNGTGIQDFVFMKSFNNIICANSSNSWMASFLSDAKKIFVPKPVKGYWSDSQDQKLIIPELHIVVEDDNR